MMVAGVEEAEGQQTYRLPKSAINNTQRVLDWREEHGDEVNGMTEVGWRRARQLASGEPVGLETVKKMAQFNRHRDNAEVAPEYESEPWRDAGYVAWLGWGGTTGIDWARKISSANQEADTEDDMSLDELARQAIETARACVNGSAMLAAVAEAKGVSPQQAANKLLDELERELGEAEWSTKFVNDLPDSSFALVLPGGEKDEGGKTTPRSLRKLPYKDASGKVDLPHLRNALARVSQVDAPEDVIRKAEAKLKAVAKEHLETYQEEADADAVPTYSTRELAVSGDLYDTAQRITDAFIAAYAPETEWREGQQPRYVVRSVFAGHPELADSVVIDDREEAVKFVVAYFYGDDGIEFAPMEGWRRVELHYRFVDGEMEATGEAEAVREATEDDTASLSEAEAAAIETGRRAPVVVDFQMIRPGPGNARDKHYYPAGVLRRDAHVFNGVDVFATDHKETDRSERTKVGKVLRVPTRFTEDGAPVAQVLIYDPAQAEKARNRNDADALDTLECSIFGTGRAKESDVGGVTYKVVEAITAGRYLELVSKAGAGGKALSLAESNSGGGDVKKQERPSPVEEVEEVEIEEAEDGSEAGTEQEPTEAPAEEPENEEPEGGEEGEDEAPAEECALGEADVSRLLEGVRLPDKVKELLARGEYADEAALIAEVDAVRETFIASTGAGRPTGTGDNSPSPQKSRAELMREREAAQSAVNAKFLRTRNRPRTEEDLSND